MGWDLSWRGLDIFDGSSRGYFYFKVNFFYIFFLYSGSIAKCWGGETILYFWALGDPIIANLLPLKVVLGDPNLSWSSA